MIRIGLVIIGDELLSGKRSDTHLPFAIEALRQRGLELAWVRLVGDDRALLIQTFRETRDDGAVVFSFGGIGATPDDLTRQCAADAFGVPLERHHEAVAILEEKFGADAYPTRIRMTELPRGARLIPNPVNRVPGFSVGHHHFVPGFPSMSHPMLEWVLDSEYAGHFNSQPAVEVRYNVLDTPESELVQVMEELLQRHAGIKIACLPSAREQGSRIDLGIKGERNEVDAAVAELCLYLQQRQVRFERIEA